MPLFNLASHDMPEPILYRGWALYRVSSYDMLGDIVDLFYPRALSSLVISGIEWTYSIPGPLVASSYLGYSGPILSPGPQRALCKVVTGQKARE